MILPETRLQPWRVTASRTIHSDSWLTVRSDDCVTPEGVAVSPYHVIEYPDWINVVVLTEAQQLLLVRQYRHGRGAVALGLVSGGIEAADEAAAEGRVLAAARRELREETGYEAATMVPLLEAPPNAANHSNLVFSTLALDAAPRHAPARDGAEVIEPVLVEFPELVREIVAGSSGLQAMHVAALLVAASRLASGTVPINDGLRRRLAAALAGNPA